jgi:hypothetical protein
MSKDEEDLTEGKHGQGGKELAFEKKNIPGSLTGRMR